MKKILALGVVLALTACDRKPDYVLNQTAFCSEQEDEGYVCKDKDGKNITGSAYEENETMKFNWIYKDGKLEGEQKYRYKSGNLAGTVVFHKGLRAGPSVEYYENGHKKFTKTYVDDELDGSVKKFYENGNLKSELTYVKGEQRGLQKYYSESGVINKTVVYDNDGTQSDVKLYDEDGDLSMTVDRFDKDNKADGWVKAFYKNGDVKNETFYISGKREGILKIYHNNGLVKTEATYKDDALEKILVYEYDDDGNLLYQSIRDKDDKETGVIYQGKQITRTQLDKELNLADCEQAVQKAIDKRQAINKEDVQVFRSSVTPNKDGLLQINNRMIVVDFAKNGVFIAKDGAHGKNRVFVYTDDTDYANNEKFRAGDYLYEHVGNYKYTTILGDTRSVPAYRATNIRYSSINPKFYLKNKKLSCCQHTQDKTTGFREIGVSYGSFYTSAVPSTNFNSGAGCRTRKHPNYEDDQVTIFTGTDMF